MIKSRQFGTAADGQAISAFQLTSDRGFQAVILDQGAILQSFRPPDGRNIALGFETWEGYEDDTNYIGRIIGPNANRIWDAKFQIDKQLFELPANDGQHNLHSGPNGFHRQHWDIERTDRGLILYLQSRKTQTGFPGTVDVSLTITLVENILRIEMRAETDRPTPMNLTWHPYWNLSGSPRIDGHDLHIEANSHSSFPAQNAKSVKDTRHDFGKPLPLGSVQLDTNYVDAKRARLISGQTAMTVMSSLPDMQVYTGAGLDSPRAGIAFEPQYQPNDINHAQNSLLHPGEIYSHWIEYHFEIN